MVEKVKSIAIEMGWPVFSIIDKIVFVWTYAFSGRFTCYDWASVSLWQDGPWAVISCSKKGFSLLKRKRVTFVPNDKIYEFVSKISCVTRSDGGLGISMGSYPTKPVVP